MLISDELSTQTTWVLDKSNCRTSCSVLKITNFNYTSGCHIWSQTLFRNMRGIMCYRFVTSFLSFIQLITEKVGRWDVYYYSVLGVSLAGLYNWAWPERASEVPGPLSGNFTSTTRIGRLEVCCKSWKTLDLLVWTKWLLFIYIVIHVLRHNVFPKFMPIVWGIVPRCKASNTKTGQYVMRQRKIKVRLKLFLGDSVGANETLHFFWMGFIHKVTRNRFRYGLQNKNKMNCAHLLGRPRYPNKSKCSSISQIEK